MKSKVNFDTIKLDGSPCGSGGQGSTCTTRDNKSNDNKEVEKRHNTDWVKMHADDMDDNALFGG